MAKSIRVSSLEELDQDRWDAYVLASPLSSIYHLSAWRRVLETSLGHPTYYLYAEQGGELVGILPLVHLRSLLFGSRLISLPGFTYAGVCAHDPNVQAALIREGIEIARSSGASHLELRQSQGYPWALAVKQHRLSMLLELPDSGEKLWQRFSAKLRNQIRKAERQDLLVCQGREDELDSFYQVFSRNMRDLGTPVQGKEFFRATLAAFPHQARIWTVYHDSEPIASGLVLGFKDTLEIPWASSWRKYNSLCANMLLYWKILSFACGAGYRLFDFGRCAPGSGTYRFKEQWGAKPHPLYWYYWLREGESLPAFHPENPKYRLAIKVWKRMPLALSRLIGPLLARDMP
ncbi:MAG: FemAB family PEP-CTERM system-associated protein [bacterium]|nr:FemAB family PEP-CTERM system-associated protein [bacterium]